MNRDGVIGQHYRTPIVQEATLHGGDKFVLASDGIRERALTNLGNPECSLPPGELADYLSRHHGKAYDDVSCLIYEH